MSNKCRRSEPEQALLPFFLRNRFQGKRLANFLSEAMIALVALLVILSNSVGSAATPTADYDVTFEATWSALTHPTGFPPSPHFSPLVGGLHNSGVVFWQSGDLSTLGMESMAESGTTTNLAIEIQSAIDLNTASDIILGGGISNSPGSVTISFSAAEDFPQLTLVSMLAPSPDWFVGVHGFNLMDNEEWVESVTVDLLAYDAGTDSGSNYTSPNQDANPQDPIAVITGSPFNGVQVGTYTITRTDTPPLAVPALGLTAQIALAAVIALGGGFAFRRYRPLFS
jgi:hypothetical protein